MYQYSTYTALWTAYPLYSSVMSTSKDVRGTTWDDNPDIDDDLEVNCWTASYNVEYGKVKWSDNIPSGSDYYARGHNIPNADRSKNGSMQTQTYYATNSTPQIQNKFNAKIWSNLEGDVRSIAESTDTVYVVTGAAFRKVGGSESITYIHPKGDENKSVPVPNYYWKVLLKVIRDGDTISQARAIGVWIPHQQYESNDYSSYVCSVDQIETWTGFDFFANLPGDNDSGIESTAESNTSWSSFQSFGQ